MPGPVRADKNRGLSLIELVIAILVLSIGILSAFSGLDQAALQIGGETARVLATTGARNRAEELSLMGVSGGRGLADRITLGPFTWKVEVDETPTSVGLVQATIRLTSPDHPGAVLVAYVPVGGGQ